jgi:outer membrane protein insertion porin family
VFVYSVNQPQGIELILNVSEFPRLSDVRWEGLDKLDREELELDFTVRIGDHLSPATVRRGLEGIRQKYRAEGYYNATVETDSMTYQGGLPQALTIRVNEGSKVKVHKIFLSGNETLTDDEVRAGFETKEDGWFSGGTFKSPEFDSDLGKLVTNYQSRGFLDAEVVSHRLEFLEENNRLDIHIDIEEGPRFYAGEITWSGNEVQGDELIAPLVTLQPGDIWDEIRFQDISHAMHNVYWESGYIYISVDPQRDIHDGVVDVHFTFNEGRPAKIRAIEIAGNTKTHENVIRREARLLPGATFNNAQLQDTQRRIFQLGFFNDVKVDFQNSGSEDDIDLLLDVEEKQTGQFTMGVGFSQQTNASGFFNIGENNLFGRGQSLQFAWQFGRRRNFLDLSFTEPWFMGSPTLVGADVFNRFTNRVNDFFDTRQKGFSLRVGRPIPGTRYSRVLLRYGLTQTTLRNFDPLYVQILNEQEELFGEGEIEFQRLDETDWPQTTSGLTLRLSRNSTDNPFFPTRGSKSSVRYEINGGVMGGDLDYQKILIDYDVYEPLPAKLAFHLGAFVGGLREFGSTEQVPDYERFRLGGNRTFKLRGYEDLQVVPRANADFPFIGGTIFTSFSAELLYPVSRAVHLLGFLDQGDTWNRFSEADLTNLRTGAGFGVRLEVPLVGRMGLDFGYGFDKDEPGWETHFNFGNVF